MKKLLEKIKGKLWLIPILLLCAISLIVFAIGIPSFIEKLRYIGGGSSFFGLCIGIVSLITMIHLFFGAIYALEKMEPYFRHWWQFSVYACILLFGTAAILGRPFLSNPDNKPIEYGVSCKESCHDGAESGNRSGEDAAYEDGYDDGYYEGYDEGYHVGASECFPEEEIYTLYDYFQGLNGMTRDDAIGAVDRLVEIFNLSTEP